MKYWPGRVSGSGNSFDIATLCIFDYLVILFILF
jgi:hypothetical protein